MNIEIDYKALRIKYINLMSILGCNYNKTQLCKELNISRPTLYKFLRNNKDLETIIHNNLKSQKHSLGNVAMRRLFNIISDTKNPKLLQIALEIGELYINNQVITNKYDNMKENDIDKTLINLLNKEIHKRKLENK